LIDECDWAPETLATGLQFPEGPVAQLDGSVVLGEIAGQCITTVSADGEVSRQPLPGGPNGLAIGPTGELLVCNNGAAFDYVDLGGLLLPEQPPSQHTGGRIEAVRPDGTVTRLYDSCDGRPLRGPNDLVVDAHGGMYFTDHGIRDHRHMDRTGVFYAAADGSSIREVIHPLESPNGIGLSPDGTRLYVAETYTGRVWQWQVHGPGEVAATSGLFAGGELLFAAPGAALLDSLAVDGDGWVSVGTLGLGEGGICAVSPDGSRVERYRSDDPLVTNICFGATGESVAYLTASATGRLLRVGWPRPGLPLAFVR
jgi:gluconolactonase